MGGCQGDGRVRASKSASLTVSLVDIVPRGRHTGAVDGLYKEFGRLLRQSRGNARMTQGQVAERVGLTRTSITNIERGTQHIALHQLFLLASAVGVAPTELLPDPKAALEELVSRRALRGLDADDEGRDFAARVLSKTPSRERQQKVAR